MGVTKGGSMPMTTFLNDFEKKTFTVVSDNELNELFQEVRKIDNRFLLQERFEVRRRFLRKSVITPVYTLYFDYLAPNSNWDIQVIGLSSDFVFGNRSNKESVMCYFYGFLSGKDK
jgi:hypothetical protein